MKKFIGTLLAFVGVTLVLSFGLDILITKGYHNYMDYPTDVWYDVRNHIATPDVAVLGSCVAQHDCNVDLLDSILDCNSYVLAMSNLTFPCHNFMWNMHYKYYHNPKPQVVVVLLDYGDMDFREVNNSMEEKQFISLTDSRMARQFLQEYGGYSWCDIYIPCYRYFGYHEIIKNGIKTALNGFKLRGKRHHQKGFIALDEPYIFHREWFQSENTVAIRPEVVKMLDDFLRECKEDNIEVVLAVTPLGGELEDIITNADDVYELYRAEAEKYGFHYVNYSQNAFSHDTANFESPNHLNAAAADIFTRQLAEYIQSLNIYQR